MPFPRLLVFDLDGTLIDSEQDLTNSVNATLQEFGRPALPAALIRTFIGDGAAMLVQRAFAGQQVASHPDSLPPQALPFFLAFYRFHKLDHTTVYAGVLESLADIRRTYPDTQLAILTNKPVNPSREICAGLGIAHYFRWFVGGDTFSLKKPNPVGLLHLMNSAGLDEPIGTSASSLSWEAVMIGDSPVDHKTAIAAGIPFIACTYGLTPATTLRALAPAAMADHPLLWRPLCEAITVKECKQASGSVVPSESASRPATESDSPE